MESHGADAAPKVELGRVAVSSGARERLTESEILFALMRHRAGDWGDLDDSDRYVNDRGLRSGSRLFSVYHTASEAEFWVITEGDRSRTAVLLPSEY